MLRCPVCGGPMPERAPHCYTCEENRLNRPHMWVWLCGIHSPTLTAANKIEDDMLTTRSVAARHGMRRVVLNIYTLRDRVRERLHYGDKEGARFYIARLRQLVREA